MEYYKKGDRILCTRCHGDGVVIDREMAVFTLGISALFGEKECCPRCGGRGFIVVR